MTEKAELLAKASKPAEEALRLHAYYKGKMQTVPKCAIRSLEDFSVWYTPGVAAPCKAIQADRELVYEYTNKANMIAVVSDGTRVLGLGDIGPEAGLPVMEGKALLFKYMGGGRCSSNLPRHERSRRADPHRAAADALVRGD